MTGAPGGLLVSTWNNAFHLNKGSFSSVCLWRMWRAASTLSETHTPPEPLSTCWKDQEGGQRTEVRSAASKVSGKYLSHMIWLLSKQVLPFLHWSVFPQLSRPRETCRISWGAMQCHCALPPKLRRGTSRRRIEVKVRLKCGELLPGPWRAGSRKSVCSGPRGH